MWKLWEENSCDGTYAKPFTQHGMFHFLGTDVCTPTLIQRALLPINTERGDKDFWTAMWGKRFRFAECPPGIKKSPALSKLAHQGGL